MEVSFLIVTYRFGKVERKDPKREDFPGPADQNLKSHITDGRKTKFKPEKYDQKKLAELRKGIQKEDNSLGPG